MNNFFSNNKKTAVICSTAIILIIIWITAYFIAKSTAEKKLSEVLLKRPEIRSAQVYIYSDIFSMTRGNFRKIIIKASGQAETQIQATLYKIKVNYTNPQDYKVGYGNFNIQINESELAKIISQNTGKNIYINNGQISFYFDTNHFVYGRFIISENGRSILLKVDEITGNNSINPATIEKYSNPIFNIPNNITLKKLENKKQSYIISGNIHSNNYNY